MYEEPGRPRLNRRVKDQCCDGPVAGGARVTPEWAAEDR